MNRKIELLDAWILQRAETVGCDQNQAASLAREHLPDSVEFAIPGDVHSALLHAGVIDDPYFRDNEYAVDWVNQSGWVVEKQFALTEDQLLGTHVLLILDGIDCVASVWLNGTKLSSIDNQFVRYSLPVTRAVKVGQNTLSIRFDVARYVAEQRKRDHPLELPGDSLNSRIPNNNFLRKTACHSGWDWNICLMPTGIYGSVQLELIQRCRIDDVCIVSHFQERSVTVDISVHVDVFEPAHIHCTAVMAGERVDCDLDIYPGKTCVDLQLTLDNPALWWPVGMGEQVLHELSITLDTQVWTQKLGLRQSRIATLPDADGPGSGFRIDINGQPLFMRGANWIPADALPARADPAAVRALLLSAIDANMNMLRVWGGGQYEADWFYAMCDELGILVWHDFMFSCNHYPASDPHWIASVRVEATQQVRRLSRFACIALWCGDNELVGALNWWELTRANRDRYLANYVRLNTALEEVVVAEVPDTPWWPSSPSQGLLDFADGWKSDAAGDMHFWDVWHEAASFSAYQDIRPRFCSEFGFQSFPSKPMIDTFTVAADRNVSSRVMGVHQRNVGGNARIVETLVRYFAFPDSFERTVFLSQCQQAMAIRTAVEYWRSLKPHCMGTLYWQLNDTWPVASWSSLEYGGGWKLLHYAAKRFYQNVLMMIVPVNRAPKSVRDFVGVDPEEDHELWLRAVNDSSHTVVLDYVVQVLDMEGRQQTRWYGCVEVSPLAAVDVLAISGDSVPAGCFLSFEWRSTGDGPLSDVSGDGEYWTRAYKQFNLPNPNIVIEPVDDENGESIVLNTDKPAFFVSVELGGRRVWSDNGFTLLPGKPKKLTVCRQLQHNAIPEVPKYSIQHL